MTDAELHDQVEAIVTALGDRVEYRVKFKPAWSAVMLELHPLPDQPWRDRAHVTQSVAAVADVYTVHRSVDGGPWMLMVSVT